MRSFLGVPIVSPEGVIGAFYLTEKIEAPDFTDEDEELIELLASHAAIAITNARLYEQLARALDRRRAQPARARAARRRQPEALRPGPDRRDGRRRCSTATRTPPATRSPSCGTLAQEALDELRSLIFELRPPDLERDGLCGALRKHVEVLRRLQQRDIELDVPGDGVAADVRARRRGPAHRPGGAPERPAPLRRRPRRRRASGRQRQARARGLRRRRRLRPARARAALPAPRADLDGGARRALGAHLEIRSEAGTGTTVRLEVDAA